MACRWRSLRLCCSLSDFWRPDLQVFAVFWWTHALQLCSSLVSGAPAALHGCAVSRWSARGLHAPRVVFGSDRAWGLQTWFFRRGLVDLVVRRLLALQGWWACFLVAVAFPAESFLRWAFPVLFIVCVCLDSLLCTYINLVIGSRTECVTNSLFQ
jgi:hypothetical protein